MRETTSGYTYIYLHMHSLCIPLIVGPWQLYELLSIRNPIAALAAVHLLGLRRRSAAFNDLYKSLLDSILEDLGQCGPCVFGLKRTLWML